MSGIFLFCIFCIVCNPVDSCFFFPSTNLVKTGYTKVLLSKGTWIHCCEMGDSHRRRHHHRRQNVPFQDRHLFLFWSERAQLWLWKEKQDILRFNNLMTYKLNVIIYPQDIKCLWLIVRKWPVRSLVVVCVGWLKIFIGLNTLQEHQEWF